jgi:hypothetical protein
MMKGATGSRTDSDTAQLYTLEGLAAAVVLLLAVTYALNAFVVSPTSDVNPGTETNQRVAEDLLAVAANDTDANNSDLKELLLNWNATAGGIGFENSTDGVYYYEGEDPDPDGLEFGEDLRNVLTKNGVSYNIDATFRKENRTGEITIVDKGEPTTSALSASRTVVLLDDDNVTKTTSPNDNVNLSTTTTYPIPKDPSRSTDVYNQVRVRITVWT